MESDSKVIVNVLTKPHKKRPEILQDVKLFMNGYKQVGNCRSWRHPHSDTHQLLDEKIAEAHTIVLHDDDEEFIFCGRRNRQVVRSVRLSTYGRFEFWVQRRRLPRHPTMADAHHDPW